MIHYSNVLHNVLIILKYKNFLGYGCYQKIIIGKKQLRQRKLPKNHNWHFFYTDVLIDSFMWHSIIIEGIYVFSCGATQYMVLCVRMLSDVQCLMFVWCPQKCSELNSTFTKPLPRQIYSCQCCGHVMFVCLSLDLEIWYALGHSQKEKKRNLKLNKIWELKRHS